MPSNKEKILTELANRIEKLAPDKILGKHAIVKVSLEAKERDTVVVALRLAAELARLG